MFIQNIYLPIVYRTHLRGDIEPGKIIFADIHSAHINNSMQAMYERTKELGCRVLDMCVDFQDMSYSMQIKYMTDFMKEYATAEYVFISSYFLPVSSCRKRKETTVVQLWHSGGLMKKMGYDAGDDIPKFYIGNPTANYDLLTVSAEICVPVWERALNIPAGVVKALGIARTDRYYDSEWNERNLRRFREMYPQAEGKKICLYAPTFEGNAADPYNRGLKSGICDVMKRLGDEWFFVVKLHPHMEKDYPEYKSEMSAEELFASADLVISDYSSIIFDFLIYRKPFLLYAPDLEAYRDERGFYVDYYGFPAVVARTSEELESSLRNGSWEKYRDDLEECFETYMGMCDGHSVDRILRMCGIADK